MLLSVRDVDLLRLLRWCRCIKPADLSSVFSETEILNLIGAGFIKLHQPSESFVLVARGHRFLEDECGIDAPRTVASYKENDITRRVRTGRLALTAYRAGLNIFTSGLDELAIGSSFFLPSVARGRGRNPWGNTRIAAIGCLGNLLCAVYSLYANCGRLALSDELRAFTGNMSGLSGRPSIILSGDSYLTVLDELDAAGPDSGSRLALFGEAYWRVTIPVHLLACDETGALQLKIMAEPDYRNRLTRAALRGQYRPPAPDLDCDAMYDGLPFLMAADMDLRRLDAAYESARGRGYPQIALAALEGQLEEVLNGRYRDTGKARVFMLTEAALTEFFGRTPTLYVPPDAAYHARKGDVLYAPLIKAHRELFKACGKK